MNKSQKELNKSIDEQPNQYAGGLMMIKKTVSTMNMVKLWYSLMSNYHLIDDSPSVLLNHPSFIENRNDQSIFSLLIRFTPRVAIEEEVEDQQSPIVDNKVFHLFRKKN